MIRNNSFLLFLISLKNSLTSTALPRPT